MLRLDRQRRRGAAFGLALALLFAQWATAAHACTAFAGSGSAASALPCMDMMSHAPTAESVQPGLCLEHCQNETPGFDSAQTPALPLAVLLPLYPATVAPVASAGPVVLAAFERRRERGPPSPHSVVHCCYRL